MLEEKKDALLAKAKEAVTAKLDKAQFAASVKDIIAIDEPTDEQAQEIADVLNAVWTEAYIEVENDRIGKPSSLVLSIVAEAAINAHSRSSEELNASLVPVVESLIKALTEGGLTCEEASKVMDVSLTKVGRLAEEVKKSIRITQDKAFKAKVGKYAPDLTLTELAELTK